MRQPQRFFKDIQGVLLFLFILGVTSCSQVPYPATYTFSKQSKMQSVNHWDILAQDAAEQLHQQLVTMPSPQAGRCVSILPDESVFGRAFTELLKANLLTTIQKTKNQAPAQTPASQTPPSGYILTDTPESRCTQVTFSTQVIRHRAERKGRFPGTFTVLTSAVAVMRNFEWYEALVGAGLLADIAGSTYNETPHNEVLITTKIASANHLLSLRSDMYYINDQDTWHYEEQKPLSGKSFQVTGASNHAN